MLADYRRKRLAARGIVLPPPRNDAEHAAIAWACEMTTLESAAAAMESRELAWADFDLMLGNLPSELGRVAAFFGFPADAERLHGIAAGPLMRRYSKALEYDYSPALRNELIAEAIHLHGREIDTALAMLHANAEKSQLLARALSRAED